VEKMKYGFMPKLMWAAYKGTFKKQLTKTLREENPGEVMKFAHKKYKEIMEVANRGYAYNFQYMEGYVANNRVSYLFKRGVDAYCDLISIERDGKTIFECYYDIFSLFRNSVIDSLQNELKYALVVTLIG